MPKIIIATSRKPSAFLNYRNEQGFTLMEVVLTVALVLVLSIGGFMAYNGFTDNAREAKVESAASEVFTAAVAQLTLPANTVSEKRVLDGEEDNSGGIALASFVTSETPPLPNHPKLAEIQEEYNKSNDDIQVTIVQGGTQDVTVTARGWNYESTRSTIPELDGIENDSGSGDGSSEEDENEDVNESEEEDTSYTGNIEDYKDGKFEFHLNGSSYIIFQGLSSDATIERWSNYGYSKQPLTGSVNLSSGDS